MGHKPEAFVKYFNTYTEEVTANLNDYVLADYAFTEDLYKLQFIDLTVMVNELKKILDFSLHDDFTLSVILEYLVHYSISADIDDENTFSDFFREELDSLANQLTNYRVNISNHYLSDRWVLFKNLIIKLNTEIYTLTNNFNCLYVCTTIITAGNCTVGFLIGDNDDV